VVCSGLDVLAGEGFSRFKGLRIGVVCNQASVNAELDHILELLAPLHARGFLHVRVALGPQHGLGGHTQDNMIEWEGSRDRRGWPVYSLYGQHREPTAEMLEGVELLVIDLPDVGSRYYTFIWTMTLCMRACARLGIPVMVLDRPNPLGGVSVEGTVLDPAFASFVGLEPLPMRHGMTIGEIARHLRGGVAGAEPSPRLTRSTLTGTLPSGTNIQQGEGEFEVVPMSGWRREMHFEDTGLPWVMPSPNMPTLDTAFVYPGGCLVEGTNLSEGRGTTRPFEILGAPFLDGSKLCRELNGLGLPGVKFRAVEFQPTFNKHAGEICQGCFVHVLDRREFKPVLTFVAILQAAIRQSDKFEWKAPPYEYEYEKLPIDILAGNDWLRSAIEDFEPILRIQKRFEAECAAFAPLREAGLLYAAL
jgi:uncharacterized protein YbbC (DUF1343 family)